MTGHKSGVYLNGTSAFIKGTHTAPSPLPPHEDIAIGSSPDTKFANTLTLTCPGSGLCESSLDRHSPSKLTQDLRARIPKQLLSAVQPVSSRRGRDFCSHGLASCASTLPSAKRTGSSSQPPHIYPACTPPGHFPPSSECRELSNIHFHSALTILSRNL